MSKPLTIQFTDPEIRADIKAQISEIVGEVIKTLVREQIDITVRDIVRAEIERKIHDKWSQSSRQMNSLIDDMVKAMDKHLKTDTVAKDVYALHSKIVKEKADAAMGQLASLLEPTYLAASISKAVEKRAVEVIAKLATGTQT